MKTIMRSTMSNGASPRTNVAIIAPRDEPFTSGRLIPTGSSRGAMMATLKTSRNLTRSPHAAGATLSEVLISLLVMSIGVVSLATLFPISVLRSLQATQLTSAANLRYNVEAFLGANPQLYTIGSPWKAATPYSVGDLVTPTGCCSPSIVLYCTNAGTSGAVEPGWNVNNGASTTDGGVTWQTYRLQNYVVDLLGKHLVETNFRQTTNGDYFGNNGTNPIQVVRAFAGVVPYYPNLLNPTRPVFQNLATNQDLAAYYAMLPDSWIDQVVSNVVRNVTANSCDLSDLPYDLIPTTPITPPPSPLPADDYPSRIVLFDITGKISHVRPISNIGAWAAPTQTITWPSATVGSGPLPTGFTPVSARVETKERRYTWMLSVRRDGDSFQMDVVVFFRRPFSGRDEQVYPATFTAVTDPGYDQKPGVASVDDDGRNGTDDVGELGWPGSDDSSRNWVIVEYKSAEDKPFYKKGGYVCDATNLRWYRILDFQEGTTPDLVTPLGITPRPSQTAGYDRAVRLTIENKIVAPVPAVANGGALMMRNIVDVYPIRTRVIGESQ